ncbi:hypothetical protein AGMMS49975_09670 [Clostridia bacterium]|nr:hypothetical protein AGMMS49975_09670 [Clostridia bacterium]
MTARRYLEQVRGIKIRLGAMHEQLECLRSATECITQQYSDMPRSTTKNINKSEDAIISVLEWEEKMKAEVNRLAEINLNISKVSSPLLQSLLVKRYVVGNKPPTWEEIANELYISLRGIHRLHDEALSEIEKLAQLGTH